MFERDDFDINKRYGYSVFNAYKINDENVVVKFPNEEVGIKIQKIYNESLIYCLKNKIQITSNKPINSDLMKKQIIVKFKFDIRDLDFDDMKIIESKGSNLKIKVKVAEVVYYEIK